MDWLTALLIYAEMVEEADGVPPTLREYAYRAGLSSTSMASRHVRHLLDIGALMVPPVLHARGSIEPGSYNARAITVTALGRQVVREYRAKGRSVELASTAVS